MATSNPSPITTVRRGLTSLAGVSLISFGVLILLDQSFHTGWISLTIPLIAGLIMLGHGLRNKSYGFIIAGAIVTGYGAAEFVLITPLLQLSIQSRVAFALLASAVAWVLLYWIARIRFQCDPTWSLIPAGVSGALGAWFMVVTVQPLEYILYIPTAIGLTLLLCGITTRLFGLIIPGCILIGIGPGVFFAWGQAGEPNGLAQTGMMLVTFSLGWGLITVFSRVITERFVWWPLIPGGVMAVVGWGLYIAGDPHNALSFIGNTGSIGLIIFGIYLLMWRNSFRR
jgi:hypothetical protein